MKSVIRLILVFALLNLAAEAHAMVEPAEPVESHEPHEPHEPHELHKPHVILTEDESIEDEMAAAKRQMKAAEKEMDVARTKMERAAGEQEARAAEREMDRAAKKMERAAARMDKVAERKRAGERKIQEAYRRVIEKRWDSVQPYSYAGPVLGGDAHARRILVIPAEQIKTKRLVTIMEDLTVMSRILDKKLGRSRHDPLFGNLSVFSDARAGTQCIYLDGYGALFIIKVDFPLAPSLRTQEQEEIEEPADRLWEETRQEIFVGPGTIRRRRIHVQQDTEHRYDAEKVEALKRDLIKSLRHAANIRALEPEQWLIVTVMGGGQPRNISMLALLQASSVTVTDKDQKETKIYAGGVPTNIASSSPTVMTIRARKADVDALAASELDLDAFREKVQVFTY